jgi:hypothetical protein
MTNKSSDPDGRLLKAFQLISSVEIVVESHDPKVFSSSIIMNSYANF